MFRAFLQTGLPVALPAVVRGNSRDVGGGFSLIEVMVAVALLGSGLSALAQLFTLATRANVGARATTVATVLAVEKMEQLKRQGADLSPSPPDALQVNSDRYCDFFDGVGRPLGGGVSPPPGTVHVRRWAVEPLGSDADDTRVLQVLVTPDSRPSRGGPPRPVPWQGGSVRLVSVHTRKER